MPASPDETIVSEASLPAAIILLCVPVVLLAAVALNGWSLSDTIYYRNYGELIYILFYGGLLYATWGFSTALRRRKTYMIVRDGVLEAFAHRKIRVSDIKKIRVEHGLVVDNILVIERNGRQTRIRTYLLKEDPDTILDRLEALTGLRSRWSTD